MRKQIFTIMKLEDKDYLDLYKQFPNIKKEDLENSLGFADREAGEIYVRKTGIKDVDNNTILHEAQELFSETSPHEKDGIRFGWFKKIFGFSSQPIMNVAAPILASMIPAIGPVLSGLLAAGTSAATQKLNTGKISPLQVGLSGLGGGLLKGAMTPGIEVAKEASKGVLGQVGAGIKSAIGMTPSGMTKTAGVLTPTAKTAPILAGGPLETYASGGSVLAKSLGNISNIAPAASTIPSWVSQVNPSAAAPATTLPSMAAPTTAPVFPQGLGSPYVSPSTGGLPPVAPTVIPPTTPPIPKTLKDLVNVPNVLGAGSIIGSMGAQQPEFQMPSTVEDIRKKLIEQTEEGKGGLTEVGKQAQLELGNILKSTPQELYAPNKDAYYEAALRRTRLSYETAKKNLDAAYNLAGVYGTGEHLAAQDKLAQQLTNAEADLYAQTEQRNFELARTAKYSAIQDALQVDRDVMDDLVGITGLDVQTAAMIYGAKAADVTAIREALGTLGAEMILRGTTGAGKQPNISLSLGS